MVDFGDGTSGRFADHLRLKKALESSAGSVGSSALPA
jgi:hypothetical protein